MTLILSGTNGVSDIDGDASTPALRGTDANSGIYFGSDTVGISAGGTQKLLIGTGSATIDGLTVGRGAGDVSSNTAVGASALAANEAGVANNTAIGYQALDANTTGDSNTALGSNALGANTTGTNNVAVGVGALTTNTTASNNTAVGHSALELNETGTGLVAMGFQALEANTTGGSNTAVGWRALQSNTTASNNTAVGYQALTANTTALHNTAVGYQALYANTTGESNIAVGNFCLDTCTTGTQNSAVGYAALKNITTGSNNIGLGINGGRTGGSPSGIFNVTTESNRIVVGNDAHTNAYVKIAWTVTSDARDKTNIESVPHGLSFVNQLNPVSYQFRKSREDDTPSGNKRYGFLAQDILALEGDDTVIIDNEQPDHLKYQGEALVPVLVNAIKELSAKNDALEARIAALEGN